MPDQTWDWEAGELQVKGKYSSVITSYDYASPVSEAGDFCQPGINGPCKWEARTRLALLTPCRGCRHPLCRCWPGC